MPTFPFHEDDLDEITEPPIDPEDSEPALEESFVLEHFAEVDREDDLILATLQGKTPDASDTYEMGQLSRPMNEYTTRLLIQCCFPTLFPDGQGGLHPIECESPREHTYSLAEYCEHLIAWHDRRFVVHPTFKFYCLNVIQRRQVDGLLTQVHPQHHADDESSATSPVDSGTRGVRQYLNDLKPFFRSVRGSGLYWSNVRQDVMAMIGSPALETPWPTFFVTLSAADTIWPDFYRVCDPTLTLEEASNLTPAQKRRYLNEHPDLAARHFHRRFQAFFQHILCGQSKPLGEVTDFFWRIEFQQRGSPHVHALLWIKDAPGILKLSQSEEGRERLRAFADRFVSCLSRFNVSSEGNVSDPIGTRPPPANAPCQRERDLGEMVRRVQQHVCSSRSSCHRDGICRFGFPKPLRESTKVTRTETHQAVKVTFERARDNDATNNYNPQMLVTWRANMDIKVIGNAYGAAEYTAAYISKAEPDTIRFRKTIEAALSKLPRDATYNQRLRRTATSLLAIREVSAQEAIYILSSGLNLYGKSRNVLRVKVTRPDRRFYRLPVDDNGHVIPATQSKMEPRIEPLERMYMERPATPQFEALTFREFCESYEISTTTPHCRQRLQRWQCLNGSTYIKGRQKKQVIRASPKFRADERDPNFCYAEMLLHKPWRSLDEIPIVDDQICATYNSWKENATSTWARSAQETIERQLIMDANREASVITLPQPNWNLPELDDSMDFEAPIVGAERASIVSTFTSVHNYSSEEIYRASNFLRDVVRPFLHDQCASTAHAGERKPFVYPTNDQHAWLGGFSYWWPNAVVCFVLTISRRRYVSKRLCSTATPAGSSTLRRLQNEFEHVHMIVIDEFGVISCGMLYWLDQRLREIFPSSRYDPFGGRDILFTGDPGQLGPIKPSPLSTPKEQLCIAAEIKGRELWEDIPLYFVLRQQNRGLDDPGWYDTIRRVRAGICTAADLKIINMRAKDTSFARTPKTVCLAYRNVDVDAANDLALQQLGHPVCDIRAYHAARPRDASLASAPHFNALQTLIAHAEELTPPGAKHLTLVLRLCVHAPIVLTFNVEQRAGLCNGSRGEVYDIIPDDGTEAHHPIVLARMYDYKGPSFLPNVTNIVPITSKTVALNSGTHGPYRFTRTALPIRLGFATTIHKIQGRTCESSESMTVSSTTTPR